MHENPEEYYKAYIQSLIKEIDKDEKGYIELSDIVQGLKPNKNLKHFVRDVSERLMLEFEQRAFDAYAIRKLD